VSGTMARLTPVASDGARPCRAWTHLDVEVVRERRVAADAEHADRDGRITPELLGSRGSTEWRSARRSRAQVVLADVDQRRP
jgi:hypothetical protein